MQKKEISLSQIVAIKGGTLEELRLYAKSKGINLPDDPDYVLSTTELYAIDPILAYKYKWGKATDRDNKEKSGSGGNKPQELPDAALGTKAKKKHKKKEKEAERKKLKRERISQMVKDNSKEKEVEKTKRDSYEIRIGLKKPKRPRMTRTPNPQIELKRTSVATFSEIRTTADIDSAVECFVWPNPKYNREDDFYVQRLIGRDIDLMEYYHRKMRAYFGIEHVLQTEYKVLLDNAHKNENKTASVVQRTETKPKTAVDKKPMAENSTESPAINSEDFEKVCKGALKDLRAIGNALIKQLDVQKHPYPIRNKKNPREISLPQPIASLACSGLLDSIEENYIGKWKSGDVLFVYAEDQTSEDKEKLENDKVMFGKYYNAILFGNLNGSLVTEGYIGFIRLGNKVTKINNNRYIEINGAELLDEPIDKKPNNVTICKTHLAKYRNITLEDGVIKVPISDTAWEIIESDNMLGFYWEKKFEGLLFAPDSFDYLFYSDNKQKYYTHIKYSDEEEEEVAVYRGTNKNKIAFLCFDFSKLRETIKKSSFDILQKKDWVLDWNCVNFKNGMIVVYAPTDGSVKFRPKAVGMPGALESFNYLKDYMNERIPSVHCSVVNMELTIYDTIRLNEAIEKFATASRQRGIKVAEAKTQTRETPQQVPFSQALSKAQQMTPEEFHKYKSKYIDYLVTLQSKKYKVIPCVERMSYSTGDTTEYAFMFSIECRSGKVLIVHENVNPDRSTLLFLVKEAYFNKSIREIYDFLQSAEINKRSSLRDKSIDIRNAGIENYRSINHDDIDSWKSTITFYKNYR